MKGKRITIKDIAKALDLSTSTVSRALSGRPDVSQSTKKAVMDLVESLEYQPDPIAVSLRSKNTHTIGVIIPQIINRFFSKAISGIQEVANENGYNLIITQSEEKLEKEKKTLQTLINSRVDGLIAALSWETVDLDHFQKAIDAGVKLVFFDRVDENTDVSCVLIDDYEASYNSVSHLIDQGCKHICIVSGPQNLPHYRKRLKGYKDAMSDGGLTVSKKQIVFTESPSRAVKTITDHFISQTPRPDGFFVINDAFAFEMMSYLKEAGLQIPRDVAVVGFNNEIVGKYFDPPLTTVESPAHELGVEAAKLLLDKINTENISTTRKLIKSKLIIRQSSMKNLNDTTGKSNS